MPTTVEYLSPETPSALPPPSILGFLDCLWLSLLFTNCCLGITIHHGNNECSHSMKLINDKTLENQARGHNQEMDHDKLIDPLVKCTLIGYCKISFVYFIAWIHTSQIPGNDEHIKYFMK